MRSLPGGRRLFLAAAGLAFGWLNSALNHGTSSFATYASKVMGADWAWLVAGMTVAFMSTELRAAFKSTLAFLASAVIGYYFADVVAGVYTSDLGDGGVHISYLGAAIDIVGYLVVATIAASGLGLVALLSRRRDFIGVVSRAVVPSYIAYSAFSVHAALRGLPVQVDPAMEQVSLVVGWLAVVGCGLAVGLGVVRLFSDHERRGGPHAPNLVRERRPAYGPGNPSQAQGQDDRVANRNSREIRG